MSRSPTTSPTPGCRRSTASNRSPASGRASIKIDVGDPDALEPVVNGAGFEAVLHFAAFKAVGDSVAQPLRYYDNNVAGTVRLLEVLTRNDVKNVVFSSSCHRLWRACRASRDRGESDRRRNQSLWLDQDHDGADAQRPGGRRSGMVGHPASLLQPGRSPSLGVDRGAAGGNPSQPHALRDRGGSRQVPVIRVFGTDYPTPDGTAVRDYVHVVDVAEGHVVALDKLNGRPGRHVYNLGTGRGSSVLEVIRTFSEATGVDLPWEPHPRRPGDVGLHLGIGRKGRLESWDGFLASTWPTCARMPGAGNRSSKCHTTVAIEPYVLRSAASGVAGLATRGWTNLSFCARSRP